MSSLKRIDAYCVMWQDGRTPEGKPYIKSRYYGTTDRDLRNAKAYARRKVKEGSTNVSVAPMENRGFFWLHGKRIPFQR